MKEDFFLTLKRGILQYTRVDHSEKTQVEHTENKDAAGERVKRMGGGNLKSALMPEARKERGQTSEKP